MVSTYSPIAQLVERLTVNQNVRGSSPRRGAKQQKAPYWGPFAFGPLGELTSEGSSDFSFRH